MKKLIAVISVLMCLYKSIRAQPNGGFETWSNVAGYQEPDGWATLNFLTLTIPSNPVSAFKATGVDKHSGSYALKLQSVYVNNNPFPNSIDDTIGLAFTGRVSVSPPGLKYGFPYTSKPEKLEFWAKYMPIGGDTAGVLVGLLHWNGHSRDTIALGYTYINYTPNYSLFKTDLIYSDSTTTPDSAVVLFGSSKRAIFSRVGSTLFVDDVTFIGSVGIHEQEKSNDLVKIFPNPANNLFVITPSDNGSYTLRITDINGKIKDNFNITGGNSNIDVSRFSEGIYLVEIYDKKSNLICRKKINVAK